MSDGTYDVRVEHVSRSFRGAGVEVHAVQDVSLQIPQGQFIAIVGRSGSGKTTLLNLIAGLDQPDSGAVFLGETEISRLNDGQQTALRRHTIGFVFQSFGLLPLLSAAENIELPLRIAGAGARERGERTRELLEQVGLTRRAHHRPYELSGGEQQRVAVARALANRPRILVADEPTGELDSTTGAHIFQLLRGIAAAGVTMITATHDPFVIEHVDHVEEMEDGRLLPPDRQSLIARPSAAPQPAAPAPRPAPRPTPHIPRQPSPR